jgi:dihydrofolate synthase/folylpolyglutamate synthase
MTTPRRKRQSPAGSPAALSARPPAWSEREAEAHLRSLELFGMRFGLDRMRRMMTVLGAPQRRYPTIHVLGTNGKTSTTRMTAAILERHGLLTGAYTSPHLISYTERVQVGERDVCEDELAAAIARAAWAAERVNRTLAEDDHVTQFELLTAAALWAMAERGVDVAVVEAGLGGRYDATSVIDSRVTALTNVGLEHTRWLGPTIHDIAEEKLAVLGERSTLALGAELAPQALTVAERLVRERAARLLIAPREPSVPSLSLAAKGEFQRRNFALAELVARSYLEQLELVVSEQAIGAAASSTDVRGRLQIVGESPLTVLDGAHNPDAVRALVRALPEVLGERPLALVLGVLDDKDAAAMLEALLPLCERAWFTAPPSGRALSPAALQSLARQLGFERVSCEPTPSRALAEARAWAGEHCAAVLATGSVYLVGDLLEHREKGLETEESGTAGRRAAP